MSHVSLLTARVGHTRHSPKRNSFLYHVFYVALPISQTPTLPSLFSIDRFNVVSIATSMHGAKDGTPLLPWIKKQFGMRGIVTKEDDTITLIAHPRLFGYAFNPISFWLLTREHALIAVLCEVRNTFGSNHNYLLAHEDQRPILPTDTFHAKKHLYVSPFNVVPNGAYSFQFTATDTLFKANIEYFQEGVHTLSTSMQGTLTPLTNKAIASAVIRYPLMTVMVVLRIHYQALRLWFKGVRPTINTRGERIHGGTTVGTDQH